MRRLLLGCALLLWACIGCASDNGSETGDSKQALKQITPSVGGSLSLDEVRLVFDPGDLAGQQPVAITIARSSRSVPRSVERLSAVYQFGPSQDFLQPVQVCFAISAAGDAQVYWSERSGPGFSPLLTTRDGGALCAQVQHFSEGFVGRERGDDPDGDAGVPNDLRAVIDQQVVEAGASPADNDSAATDGDIDSQVPDAQPTDSTSSDSGAISDSGVDGQLVDGQPREDDGAASPIDAVTNGDSAVDDSGPDAAEPDSRGSGCATPCPAGQACSNGVCRTFRCGATEVCNDGADNDCDETVDESQCAQACGAGEVTDVCVITPGTTTMRVGDGVLLDIPSGAITVGQLISVSTHDTTVALPPDNLTINSVAISFWPRSLRLRRPITISLPMSQPSPNSSIWRISDKADTTWDRWPAAWVELENNRVVFSLRSFVGIYRAFRAR